jgi:hypothetical protein
MSESLTAKDFRARFASVDVGHGGVAFDLTTGGYFALNASAAVICARLCEGDERGATAAIAARLGLAHAHAEEAIAQVLRGFARPGAPATAPPPGDVFPYRRAGDAYVLFHHDRPLLQIDATARTAHVRPEAAGSGFSGAYLLRLASPKILQANGIGVLHAAARTTADGVLVVCGRSGAGKSTTATLLGEALSAPAFADDLVILGEGPAGNRARPGAEERVYAWCESAGPQLTDAPVALEGLIAAATATDATAPLREILVVARERRAGPDFRSERLPPAAALIEILNAVFLGTAEPVAIRRYLETCRALALGVPIARAHAPDGLPALRAALQSYR